MIVNLITNLELLSSNHGVIGLKQSFEDEGIFLDDLLTVRRITDICNLKLFVKIGGCEAKTDINNCIKYGVNGIIAPMVESSFALSKFTDITSLYSGKIQSYIVIETKTAYENLDEILEYGNNKLNGIIVGRSDFSKSYLLNKSEVNSNFVFDKIKKILVKSKNYNYQTTLGGNISTQSGEFIKKMYFDNLLDKIETRNVVIKLSDDNIHTLEKTIQLALEYEIELLKYKRNIFSLAVTDLDDRIKSLINR
jgi:4-hydroxy-2-oxoheptanedioate aldolase